MSDLRIMQIQFELDTWKRVLYCLMDENAHLKVRLSEVLKNNNDAVLLEKSEFCQNCFLLHDDLLSVLRDQFAKLNKQILKNQLTPAKILNIKERFISLRRHMMEAECDFSKIRNDYNEFLFNFFFDQHSLKDPSTNNPEKNSNSPGSQVSADR